MLKAFLILVVIITVPIFSFANSAQDEVERRDTPGTGFVTDYLSRLKDEKTAIFYSECYLKDGGKASILIPLGKKEGLYIERSREKTVVNTADMIWADGRWRTEVAQGGVYTITRTNNMIGEILEHSFQIISPDKLDIIRTSKPKVACIEKLSE